MGDEDAFDAHFTAAAVLRCLLEGKRITHPRWIEAEAEGSMLIAGVVDPYQKGESTENKTTSFAPITASVHSAGSLSTAEQN